MNPPATDNPEEGVQIRARIEAKPLLKRWYEDIYRRYAACLSRAPSEGLAVEIGSGAGFARDRIPGLITTDILPYPNIDQVLDATRLPYADGSLRALVMLNVFHHLKDPAGFLDEAVRCLALDGRLLVVDQYPGWLAWPIYAYVHPEPFDDRTPEWGFSEGGPLSGANGAQAHNVFVRDQKRFREQYPELEEVGFSTFAPLAYWLSGGLQPASLAPRVLVPWIEELDRWLVQAHPKLGSFAEWEWVRRARPQGRS